MHKAAVALLAIPIIAAVYVGAALRRSTVVRAAIGIGLAVTLGAVVVGAGTPALTVATPERPIVPLTQAAFRTTVATNHTLTDPVTIEFTTPMDPASVEAALTVDPPTEVELAWDATGTSLTITPRTAWAAAAFHTVAVQAGALAQTGQPLARPARAVFITRAATSGEVAASDRIGSRVSVATSFQITFVGPVDLDTVDSGVSLVTADPGDDPIPGTLSAEPSSDGSTRFTFTPSDPLRPDHRYRLKVAGVLDPEGIPIEAFSLLVRTSDAPAVVRFRPRTDTLDVVRDSAISVRFTESMDRKATARAFKVTIGDRAIAGSLRWAESDTVLVFTPKALLPYEAKVVVEVGAGAVSAAGARIAEPGRGIFRTVQKPIPANVAAAGTGSTGGGGGGSTGGGGGGAVGGGSWGAVETYYLGLMNCTRTGGWVTSTGSCSSPGGRNVAALKLDSGISSKVSRPYAKRLATGNDCSHFIGGNPGDRLERAGYTSYRWAENLGCRSGDPRSAVLASHLFFQSEKSYNGGHYVNMMNAQYDRVGIGVWVYSGRVRLVVDFYHP